MAKRNLHRLPGDGHLREFRRRSARGRRAGSASTIVLAVPGAQAAAGRKGQLQHAGARQPIGQHRGQAIAGHDVEADGRNHGHAGRLGAARRAARAHSITSISPVMSR